MLIKSYDERLRRQAIRHGLVLRFLRDETWTSSPVLAALLGSSPASVSKTMYQLERKGHVIRHVAEPIRCTLWGITSHGLAHAWEEHEQMQVRGYFEPSKLSMLAVPHHLDIQRARLGALRAGWSDWMPESLLPTGISKRPDAVASTPDGQRVAVEVERHVKTLKRYEAIFAAYLQAIKRGEYDAVHYVVPDRKFAKRLERVFGLVLSVPVLGERVPITDRHRARFIVSALADWPAHVVLRG